MKLKTKISQFWHTVQGNLFAWLEEELPPLSKKQQQLVLCLELIRIEEFIPSFVQGFRGRPIKNRAAIARSFIAKAIYNFPTTTVLIDRLHSDISFRRLCGWENRNNIPSESVFSRAFAEFAESDLPSKVHEALIIESYQSEIVGHAITDATSIEAREKPKKLAKKKQKKGYRKIGEKQPHKMTRIEKQAAGVLSLEEMLKELPRYCDTGAKTNSKGHLKCWNGYKLHITTDDNGVPLAAITTSASLNDSQVAIPLAKITAQRVVNLYDVMDSGYYAEAIKKHSEFLGHVPIIKRPAKTTKEKEDNACNKKAYEILNWMPSEDKRYECRTTVERAFARLKDEFGANFVRVRGGIKVCAHLMFSVLAFAADQLLKIH